MLKKGLALNIKSVNKNKKGEFALKLNRKLFLQTILTLLIVSIFATTSQAANFWDMRDHWAKEYVDQLVAKKIISGYPDNSFRPEGKITRAEFAKMVVTAFSYDLDKTVKFNDTKKSWAKYYIATLNTKGILNGYPDKTFRPNNNITRAEVVKTLVTAMKLLDKNSPTINKIYADVPNTHWAAKQINLATKLGFTDGFLDKKFKPSMMATRVTVAEMMALMLDLQTTNGRVISINTLTNTVKLRLLDKYGISTGQSDVAIVMDDTILLRNSRLVNLKDLQVNDQVLLVSNQTGDLRYVKATGLVTQNDILYQVSSITKGTLTPPQIELLLNRNWSGVGSEVKTSIVSSLIKQGLTQAEATALINKDWSNLDSLGKERLSEAVAAELRIEPDIAMALMGKDWTRLKTLVQLQLAQQVLGQIMNV